MRILIGGDDEVAFRLVEALMEDHEVILVCPESAKHENRMARMDAERVIGSMTSPPILRQAGVADADLFVGCSPVDERNLVACVSAKRLGAGRSVCFLSRPDLQMPGEDAAALAQSLGIDDVVRPGKQLATEILRIIAVRGALDVQVFAGGRVHLLRYAVEAGAALVKGPLKDIGVPEGVVLVMARRGDDVFVPNGETCFEPGDKVTAMGSLAGINRLLAGYLRSGASRRRRMEATVVGGGSVGLAVATGLEDGGWNVKVIETDRKRCEEIAPVLDGLVLHGDGTDLDLLQSERIGESPMLVAVTSNDEKNLLVSLLAKSLGVSRIVTRADHLSNERLFEQVGIDVVRSARGAAVRSVLRMVDVARAELLAELEHGDAEVLELVMPDDLPEIPIMNMRASLFGIIGAILRRGRVIIPRGTDHVEGGDHLLVFCMSDQEDAVRQFFLHRLPNLAPTEK
ncbi:MAG: Trk system potassium transporter TrkA [Planctomycetota bacterium]|nr:Trk system potassium transporter TrkA [Planctomycetota bacterium]